jgi:transposase
MRFLDKAQKEKCLQLFKEGYLVGYIADTLNTTEQAIKFYKNLFICEGSLPPQKMGRPTDKKLTPEQEIIIKEAEENMRNRKRITID